MDIEQLDLLSPGPVADEVTETMRKATTVAVFGKAKNLAELQASARLRYLWISGVNAKSAATVGGLQGLQRLVIHNLQIEDLSALSQLKGLEDLIISGSAKLTSLKSVEHLHSLRRLILFDSCGWSDIERLADLTNLRTLCLEGGFSKDLSLPTLAPLASLTKLERLRLASVKVADGSLRPLHALSALEEAFVDKSLPRAELEALGNALPGAKFL